MKTKLAILALVFCAALVPATPTASDYITWGSSNLTLHTSPALWAANTNFAAATAAAPTNETANALWAVTRLLVLPQTPAGSNFLNGLGITNAGRDIYNWQAPFPKDTNYNPVFPANYNSSTAIAFLRTNILAAIGASATNLANIKSPGFTLTLPAAYFNNVRGAVVTSDVVLDYGDIQLLRAMLAAGQFAGYTLNTYNFSVVIPTLQKMSQTNGLTIQSVLAAYTSLLTLSTASDLTNSKTALTNAIAYYFAASDFIRNQRAPGGNPLFKFDTGNTNDVATEAILRSDLTNVLASLNGPAVIDPKETFTINASNYFSSTKGLRVLVPQFNRNAYVNHTLPDYTFGSILGNVPAFQIEAGLRGAFHSYAGIYEGQLSGSLGGELAIFVSTNQQATLVAYDYDSAYNLGVGGFGAQFPLDSGGYFYFVTNIVDKINNAAYSVTFSGQIHQDGTFNCEVDYADDINSIYSQISSQNDYQISPLGGYQTVAGLYNGTWSLGGQTGKLWGILDPVGYLYFCNFQTNGAPDDGGKAGFDSVATNSFYLDSSAQGSQVAGTLNRTTPAITGTVTNAYGNGAFTLSRAGNVPFDLPPAFTVALTNKTVQAGSNATFTATVTGSAPLAYQWFCNGAPVPGAGTNSLTISNASLALNGNFYSVTVQNAVGGTNSGAFLLVQDNVKPALVFSNLVAGQRVSNATFTVTGAAGDASGISAVWYRLGTNGTWTLATTTNNWANWSANLALAPGSNTLYAYAVDRNIRGTIYVADSANNAIRKVTPAGVVTTLAGNTNSANGVGYADGTSAAAKFSGPTGVAVDNAGNIYVADLGNNLIRKVTTNGVVTTIAGDTNATDLAIGTNNGYADGVGSAALFNSPSDIAVDNAGNLYVADSGNSLIRKITTNGVVTTIAGDTNATDLAIGINTGYADGVGSAALFYYPDGIAVDGSGDLYVSDTGNNLIRKITPDGTVTTLSGDTNATDLANGTNNGYADGIGSSAKFNVPIGIAVDGAGNICVADTYNNLIRKITTDGTVSTLAGDVYDLTNNNSNNGYFDGTNTIAQFNNPLGVAVDNFGSIYIGDYFNDLIRKISVGNWVTTLAGSLYGFGSTDGTNGTAQFNYPMWVAVDNGGGNASVVTNLSFVYVPSAVLQVVANGLGTVAPNYSNAVLAVGTNYSMAATAGTGFTFTNWFIATNGLPGGRQTNNATVQFTMASNLVLTVTFKDTTIPTIGITNLTAGQRISNATYTVRGTAADNWAVTNVSYRVGGGGWNTATGTTNWSGVVTLAPGTNVVSAFALDQGGNQSAVTNVSVQFVVTNQLTVQTVGLGALSTNYNNAWLEIGRAYGITATPAAGFVFANWLVATNGIAGGFQTNGAALQFTMASNLVLTATFSDTNRPAISITNLANGSRLLTNSFLVKGTATDNWLVTNVSYRVGGGAWTNATGTTNWSGLLALLPGTNVISAYATDNSGNQSAVTNVSVQFVVTNLLSLRLTNGLGTLTPTNTWLEIGRAYSVTSAPAAGFIFTNWTVSTNGLAGATVVKSNIVQFLMASNLDLLAKFLETNVPKLTVSAPTNSQRLTNALAGLAGTTSDSWKVTGVWYQVNGGGWNLVTATTNSYTNWTQAVPLPKGTNTLKAYALNLGGIFSLTNTISVVSSNDFKLLLAFSNAPVSGGSVAFNLQLSPGMGGRVQVSTNLQDWATLTNFPAGTNASITVRDPAATNAAQRFYRAVTP